MSRAAQDFAAERELFERALEVAPEERAKWVLAQAANQRMAARVTALLAAAADDDWLRPLGEARLEGTRVADFVVEQKLGEGGMGVVYLARQEHPQRQVALKVMRLRPGQVEDLRRFELEADAMARLDHPNVARVHSAGTLEGDAGTLAWFAMELVDGARDLTEFAEQEELTLARRLELFDAVAAAIEHGHSRGVLHRDIKPANVLVDRGGAPRVIDFGIAALLADSGDAHPARSLSSALGTLAYSAPETLSREGSSGSFDPRVDVHALGAVLHELLAGAPIRDLAGMDAAAAREEILRSAPAPLSARRPDLARDLCAVVDLAVDPDPSRRYADVRELREDLRRARGHLPVAARPAGPLRRCLLFLRRNAAACTTAALVLAALVVATAASLIAADHARGSADAARRAAEASEARATAERAARIQAERVRAFLDGLFSAARPVAAMGRPVAVADVIDGAAAEARLELADEPGVLGEVLASLGLSHALLGRGEVGAELLVEARGLLEQAGIAGRLPELRSHLGLALFASGRTVDAERELRAAVAALADGGADGSRAHRTARRRHANALTRLGRPEEALDVLDWPDEGGLTASDARERAEWLVARGQAYVALSDFDSAVVSLDEAVRSMEALLPADHYDLAAARNSLGNARFRSGDLVGAEASWSAALATYERILDDGHPDLATVAGNVALALDRRGEDAAAREAYARAIALRRTALGDSAATAVAIERLGSFHLARGRAEEARGLFQEAVDVHRRALVPEEADATFAVRLRNLALAERQLGRLEAAERALEEMGEVLARTRPADDPEVASALTLRGIVRLERGDPGAARPLLERALEIRRARLAGHWLEANSASCLGGCLVRLNAFEAAEALLLEADPVLARALGARDFRRLDGVRRLVELYEAWGRSDQAEAWRRELE